MNQSSSTETGKAPIVDTKPWYYYPWVWFILALLASAVSASLYTVKIAVSLPSDLLPVKVSKFALESEVEKPAASISAPSTSEPEVQP